MAEGYFDDTIITKEVCRGCIHQIQEFFNFGTLQRQFEKHQIPLYMHSRRKKVCRKPHAHKVDYMLDSLDKVEDGFQTLYDCLRETQYSCPKHKLAADILKKAATSKAVSKFHNESNYQSSIYSERIFIYKGKEDKFTWDEAGISLSFPKAKCKKDIKLSIKVIHDDLVLPSKHQDMALVSAMYKITASDELPKPATVKIQHCAIVDKEDSLIFLVAHGKPPYRFEPLPGGSFPLKESYGEIKVKEFSFFILLQNIRHRNMRFAVHIVYCRDGTADFVVTKNIAAHVTAIKEEYHNATKFDTCEMKCSLLTDAITLSLPENPTNGWRVESSFEPPKISLTQIREYQPGKIIPRIKLSMRWFGIQQPREESVKIRVNGGDFESFRLICKPLPQLQLQVGISPTPSPPMPVSSHNIPSEHDKPTLPLLQRFPTKSGGVIKIIQEIGMNKHDFGIRLLKDVKGTITDNIEAQHNRYQPSIMNAIFQKWLEGTGRTPQSWGTLVTVLREIELHVLAQEIEDNLLQERGSACGSSSLASGRGKRRKRKAGCSSGLASKQRKTDH